MAKKIAFSAKPGAKPIESDQWVENRTTEETKRLTFDIPDSLHRRIKSQCAIRGVKMAEVIRQLLEKQFPDAT